jgi:FMN phosphatase YigB (HAD superfamily)
MRIRAVVFDLFKTLGEFQRLITDDEATSFLRAQGYEVYPQAWRHAFSFVVFIDYPKEGYKTHEALFRQVFKRLGLDVDETTIVALSTLFRDSPFVLYRESVEAIRRAKDAGLKTAIATSTPKPFFTKGVEPIEGLLDYICTGYEAGYEKSNPQIYRRILDKLEVKPEETAVIGDNPILDVLNPRELGLRTIQIVREETPSESADETAENVLEAVKIIQGWI